MYIVSIQLYLSLFIYNDFLSSSEIGSAYSLLSIHKITMIICTRNNKPHVEILKSLVEKNCSIFSWGKNKH